MSTLERTLRVVLVDDHPVVRQGTKDILESRGHVAVVGEAGNSLDAVQVIGREHPDIAILDIRLPGESGIDLITRLSHEYPETKLLILSAYGDRDYLRAAMAAGVAGYLLKSAPDEEILDAVYAVMSGAIVIDRSLALGMRDTGDAGAVEARSGSLLSARELEVVRLVTQGLSNKAIADAIGISRRTVETHVRHIFDKLGVNSRTQLSLVACERGLLEEE